MRKFSIKKLLFLSTFKNFMNTENKENDPSLIENIRVAAYFIHLTGKNSNPLQDWLDAELQIKNSFRYIYFVPRKPPR
jgi:hypothetical protein